MDERVYQILVPMCKVGELIAETVADGVFRVKRYRHYHLDIQSAELGNRLVMEPYEGWDEVRFWWYDGTGPECFMAAAINAAVWDPGSEPNPLGWNENGQTGQRRPADSPEAWQVARWPRTQTTIEADDSMWPDLPRAGGDS